MKTMHILFTLGFMLTFNTSYAMAEFINNIDQEDQNGQTALHRFAVNIIPQAIQECAQSGKNFDTLDQQFSIKLAQLIINKPGRLMQKDKFDHSPYDYIQQIKKPIHHLQKVAHLSKLLYELETINEAEVDKMDERSQTALLHESIR
jgi:hypothetical protein